MCTISKSSEKNGTYKISKGSGTLRQCVGFNDDCQTQVWSSNGKMCSRCKHRKIKHTDTEKYTYNMQKSNARKRKPKHHPLGIPFKISLKEWRTFWQQNKEAWKKRVKDLMEGTKDFCSNISLDRINPFKGYEVGNIQVMTVLNNTLKWCEVRSRLVQERFLKPFESLEAQFANVPY